MGVDLIINDGGLPFWVITEDDVVRHLYHIMRPPSDPHAPVERCYSLPGQDCPDWCRGHFSAEYLNRVWGTSGRCGGFCVNQEELLSLLTREVILEGLPITTKYRDAQIEMMYRLVSEGWAPLTLCGRDSAACLYEYTIITLSPVYHRLVHECVTGHHTGCSCHHISYETMPLSSQGCIQCPYESPLQRVMRNLYEFNGCRAGSDSDLPVRTGIYHQTRVSRLRAVMFMFMSPRPSLRDLDEQLLEEHQSYVLDAMYQADPEQVMNVTTALLMATTTPKLNNIFCAWYKPASRRSISPQKKYQAVQL